MSGHGLNETVNVSLDVMFLPSEAILRGERIHWYFEHFNNSPIIVSRWRLVTISNRMHTSDYQVKHHPTQ